MSTSENSTQKKKESCEISQKNIEDDEQQKIIIWVNDIKDEKKRDHALEELHKRRESITTTDLAIYIWYSTGTIAALLQEIIYTYQFLNPPKLTREKVNKICTIIALFQCVVENPDTCHEFLKAQLPIFLYPFLNTINKSTTYEYLKLTALGVIGALVKVNNPEAISFLLNTEIIPLCLKIMERGTELSKTIVCFIIQRIALDENGLKYICEKPERLFAIDSVLSMMIKNKPSQRLNKHIIRIFSRLSENNIAKNILKDNLPQELKNENYIQSLDDSSKKWLNNLFKNLNDNKNNNMQNISVVSNNQQKRNSDVINQNNLNVNLMLVNQMNQMNIQQSQAYMMPATNIGDFGYNIYNGENYMNKSSFINMQNGNKGFNNIPFYTNTYKNN